MRSACWALILGGLAVHADMALRIEDRGGGPQVLLNGEPIPLRCFFGSRRSGNVAVGSRWQTVSYSVIADRDLPGNGTLHLRFDQRRADYVLRHVKVSGPGDDQPLPPGSFATREAFAGMWEIWPPGERNSVGAVVQRDGVLHVAIRPPADGQWPDFHLHSNAVLSLRKGVEYEVSFEVKASEPATIRTALYAIRNGVWTAVGSPPGPFMRELGLARDAGVRFISTGFPSCWEPPGEEQDWGPLDRVMRQIIAEHPTALIIPRIGCNAPGWWLEEHPEARMMFEGGKEGRMASVSSRAYRRDTANHLEKLCRHLSETFPDHFAGIHPCGQNTGEWFYDESWGRLVSGYEPVTAEAWQAWQREQAFGGNADVAAVPSPAARHGGPNGCLRSSSSGEPTLVRFNRFWQEEMADMVLELAAACRRGTDGRRLVVFFYGYLFEFPPLFNGAPYSGHYALREVLTSADIDVLCSPISYFDRQWLGTGACMSVAESVALAGKVWLNEDDTRTYLADTTRYGGVADLEQTIAVLRRNTAQAALRGFGTWWMDLPGTGWFDDARIWAEHTRLASLDQAMLERDAPYTPDIALVIHEPGMWALSGKSSHMARPLIYEARAAAGRCGAPYGQYLLQDVIGGRVPARLQLFLSPWSLSADEITLLNGRREAGVTRVWCYAPAALSSESAQRDLTAELTGWHLRQVTLETPVATPTAAGRALGITQAWGQNVRVDPLFTIVPNAGDEVLATYSNGVPALVVRESGAGADVFAGVPAWTPEVIRGLARLASVHLYAHTDAALWVAQSTMVVHALQEGPLELDIGEQAAVRDRLSGEAVGRGPILALPISKGETRVIEWRQ